MIFNSQIFLYYLPYSLLLEVHMFIILKTLFTFMVILYLFKLDINNTRTISTTVLNFVSQLQKTQNWRLCHIVKCQLRKELYDAKS